MRIGVSLEIVVRLFLSLFADLSFPLLSNILRRKCRIAMPISAGMGSSCLPMPFAVCLSGGLPGYCSRIPIMSHGRCLCPFGNAAVAFPRLNTRLRGYHPLAEAVGMGRAVFIEFRPNQAAVCGLAFCASRHIPRSIAVPFHTQFLRHPIAVPLGPVNGANHRHIFYARSVPLVSQYTAVGRTGIIAALSVRQL